jgi:hypothetical protein
MEASVRIADRRGEHLLGSLSICRTLSTMIKLTCAQHAGSTQRKFVDPVCMASEHTDHPACVCIPHPDLPIVGARYEHVVPCPYHRVHRVAVPCTRSLHTSACATLRIHSTTACQAVRWATARTPINKKHSKEFAHHSLSHLLDLCLLQCMRAIG